MAEYSCYIVDDEVDSLEILADYINQTPDLQLMYSTTNPRDLLPEIRKEGKPKITFLDIEMPGINGLELANLINRDTAVIFVTSHSEYALEAFDKEAYDFLLKPVSYPRFLQAILKVQGRVRYGLQNESAEENYFYVKGNMQGEVLKIYYHEILYVESLKNYVRLYTDSGRHITYLTLKEFESKVNRKNFFKIHKSFLINLDRMSALVPGGVKMEDGEQLPIGPVYRHTLLTRIRNRTIFSTRRKDSEG